MRWGDVASLCRVPDAEDRWFTAKSGFSDTRLQASSSRYKAIRTDRVGIRLPCLPTVGRPRDAAERPLANGAALSRFTTTVPLTFTVKPFQAVLRGGFEPLWTAGVI
jgi:hypothetical protein